MTTTPKNCEYPVGTLDGKRFVGYKIVSEKNFGNALYGLFQSDYRYPDKFINGKTLFNPGTPDLCTNGWHAWRTLWHTRDEIRSWLRRGKSLRLFAVEIWGQVQIQEDKFVGSHMKVLYEIPINWNAKRFLPSRTLERAWNRYLAKRKGNK